MAEAEKAGDDRPARDNHGSMNELDESTVKADFLRWRDGADPAALARVFDRTAPHLLRLARHVSGSRADAEDAVQGTFLVALERSARFDASRPFLPWLCGVLVLKAKEAARRSGRSVVAEPVPDSISVDPLSVLADRETSERVRAAVDALPPAMRRWSHRHRTRWPPDSSTRIRVLEIGRHAPLASNAAGRRRTIRDRRSDRRRERAPDDRDRTPGVASHDDRTGGIRLARRHGIRRKLRDPGRPALRWVLVGGHDRRTRDRVEEPARHDSSRFGPGRRHVARPRRHRRRPRAR